MRQMGPFGPAPPEVLVLRLARNADEARRRAFLDRVCSLLPHLNWRSHVYVITDGSGSDAVDISEVVRAVGEFVAGQRLSTVHVHPFIRMRGLGDEDSRGWEGVLHLMQPFQQEAYDRQGEIRLLVLPIVEPLEPASPNHILSVAEFFGARLAKPSFYFHGESPLDAGVVLERDLRVYVDPAPETSPEGLISQLRVNHVFESVLDRVSGAVGDVLEPCRRHLVVDEERGEVFACLAAWITGEPVGSLDRVAALPELLAKPWKVDDCTDCISRSCITMRENLHANGKTEEARRVHQSLAVALSDRGDHSDAARHARGAFEFSMNDADKAAALLHEGLCHVQLRRFDEAEAALREGAQHASDSGPFSYHRGTVAFARGDYAGAIDRFTEAVRSDSPEVHRDDALFNLATSYIKTDDFASGRRYLDVIDGVSAPVRFYQGICALGAGQVESALRLFMEALAMEPAPEDLSRVLFYVGNCLKELGRYDEAIAELQRAAKADPDEYMNYNLLGFCFFQTKRYEDAIRVLHRAIEINPTSAIDYASLGSNLRELGRLEDAIAMYNMALSLDPSLTFAMENMVKLKEVLKRRSAP